jgi:hypothetical protein
VGTDRRRHEQRRGDGASRGMGRIAVRNIRLWRTQVSLFGYLVLVIWLFGYLVIWLFGYLVIYLVIWYGQLV